MLWAILALALVGLLGFGAWAFNQRQFFVAENDGKVAIFRGMSEDFAGVPLSSVYRTENIPMDALNPATQTQVRETIVADDLNHAERTVKFLLKNSKLCQAVETTTMPTPTPTPTPTPGMPTPGQVPPGQTPPAPGAPMTPAPGLTPAPTPSPTPTPTTPRNYLGDPLPAGCGAP